MSRAGPGIPPLHRGWMDPRVKPEDDVVGSGDDGLGAG